MRGQPRGQLFPSGPHFEFDGTKLTEVAETPNSPNDASYNDTMLVLPTGQILMTDQTNDVEVYTSPGKPNPAWAPKITSVPRTIARGQSYTITGTLFNGVSQGAAYGDDAQMATNYPIVVIYNKATKHIFRARTHDHSSMAVQNPNPVSTHFDVPSNTETGASLIVVVTNGIRSNLVSVTVQ